MRSCVASWLIPKDMCARRCNHDNSVAARDSTVAVVS